MNNHRTLKEYLLDHLADHPEQRELVMIMSNMATIGETISTQTNKAGLAGILGSLGQTNIQGETIQRLDVFANELCKKYLRATEHFAAMASEEESTVVDMGNDGARAKYVIAFDPLDGSSNIDVNVSIGTIFSVHKRLFNIDRLDERQFLQKGRDQVLAGYILYGSSTVLVFSFGDGVHEFTLDHGIGEYFLSNERVMIPPVAEYYSVNEGNTVYFERKDADFIAYLRDEKKLSARYIGSLVADFHRNMIKGGVYLYPAVDKGGKGIYTGKIRLNYELKPMAFLLEQAGGLATDGEMNILDMEPTSLHERRAAILGSRDIVEEYMAR